MYLLQLLGPPCKAALFRYSDTSNHFGEPSFQTGTTVAKHSDPRRPTFGTQPPTSGRHQKLRPTAQSTPISDLHLKGLLVLIQIETQQLEKTRKVLSSLLSVEMPIQINCKASVFTVHDQGEHDLYSTCGQWSNQIRGNIV